MNRMHSRLAALAIASVALAAVPAGDAFGQSRAANPPAVAATDGASTRGADDMRLWTFGDCDRRFPAVDSDQHKECARAVASDEARDARAYRVCEASHSTDPDEAARCKAAYDVNRAIAAKRGYVPHAAEEPAAPPPEVTQKVASPVVAAVERDRTAAKAPDAPAPVASGMDVLPTVPIESWSPTIIVGVASLFVLMLAIAAMVARRKGARLFHGR